jgi:hypothetical protein
MIDLRRPGQRSFGEGFIEEETASLWEPWMRQADQVLDKRAIIRPEGSADSGATANSDPHRSLRERYSAAAGSACRLYMPFGSSGYYHAVWVPVGETEGGDNTSGMLSTSGLHSAQWLQRMLGLAPIEAIVAAP